MDDLTQCMDMPMRVTSELKNMVVDDLNKMADGGISP